MKPKGKSYAGTHEELEKKKMKVKDKKGKLHIDK